MTDPARRKGSERPGASLRGVVGRATEEIQQTLATAEREIEMLQAEAEAEAERYMEAARAEAERVERERLVAISAQTDALTEQLHSLRDGVEATLAAIDRTLANLQQQPGVRDGERGPRPLRPRPRMAEAPPPPVDLRQDVPPPPVAPDRPAPEEAMLHATQMAVAGSGREEIEDTLRTEYGLADPARLVTEILGPRGA
jgi:hypothetical protein